MKPELPRDQGEVRIFKLNPTASPTKKEKADVHRFRYGDDNEYKNVLLKAQKDGIAYVIDGEEPTDKEIREIKKIYDRFGTVKVFRKKKKLGFGEGIAIKPSSFANIKGLSVTKEEVSELKNKVCGHITHLINNCL